ncbi:MAG: hypothetical protein Q4A31_09120 [Corynebacterium sp.]|uniref:VWA domain-containing protein n=1 Tax=Corynebacterium sp. TaxID=1720 RepID=UPI0026DD27A1|nr:VWA domain-containing protein [Corynebacterium sp.]MDO4762064.1 hypothetical protein [Corynebacterium sp.]
MFRKLVLLIGMMALSVAGCAMPDGLQSPRESEDTGMNIRALDDPQTPTKLLVDISSSMNEYEGERTRFDIAAQSAEEFFTSFQDPSVVDIDAFGGDCALFELAGFEHEHDIVEWLKADFTPRGQTPLVSAIMEAARSFQPAEEGVIVVLSDGMDTCGGDLGELADFLKNIYPKLRLDAVVFKEDASELAFVAQSTGGIAVSAHTDAQLTRRLLALRDEAAKLNLSEQGVEGIALGDSVDQLKLIAAEFSECSGDCTVVYRDCAFVVENGSVVKIILGPGSETIDGLRVGASLDEVEKLLGQPIRVQNLPRGQREHDFAITETDLWRVTTVENAVEDITLCRCNTINADRQFHNEQSMGSVRVGDRLGQHREKLFALNNLAGADGFYRVGNYIVMHHLEKFVVYAEVEDDDPFNARIKYLLPYNRFDGLRFASQAEADLYFQGAPSRKGVSSNSSFAYYPIPGTRDFFLVQWLVGFDAGYNNELTPVHGVEDFADGQALTAMGRMAFGFGLAGPFGMKSKPTSPNSYEKVGCQFHDFGDFAAVYHGKDLVGYASVEGTPNPAITARALSVGDKTGAIDSVYSDVDRVGNVLQLGEHYLGFGSENGRISGIRTGTYEFVANRICVLDE